MRRAAVALTLIASAVVLSSAATAARVDGSGSADRDALETVMADPRLELDMPTPGAADWIAWMIRERTRDLVDAIAGHPAFGPRLVAIATLVGKLLGVLAVLLALVAVAALVVGVVRSRRRRVADETTVSRVHESGSPPPVDPEWWWGQRTAAVKAGDLSRALHALWWWLARSLVGAAADSSWTCRELFDRAARSDLREPVGRLERMCYATGAVTLDEVDGLSHELRDLLAAGGPGRPR